MAIAEWPTESGPADYALFVGLTCVGVIEAKRKRKNVSAAIDQAERYSRDFSFKAGERAGGPWDAFRIPFLFATNGPTSNKSKPRAVSGFETLARPPIDDAHSSIGSPPTG
jgi:type I site-specific restriction endonuclease